MKGFAGHRAGKDAGKGESSSTRSTLPRSRSICMKKPRKKVYLAVLMSSRVPQRVHTRAVPCRKQRFGEIPREIHLRHLHAAARLPAPQHGPGDPQLGALPPVHPAEAGADDGHPGDQAQGHVHPALSLLTDRAGTGTPGDLNPPCSLVS